jgi:hypothetical protein
MQTKLSPLLCELHAHSTWSDGSRSLRELCDIYGRRGFDVLACLRSARPAYLVRLEDAGLRAAA